MKESQHRLIQRLVQYCNDNSVQERMTVVGIGLYAIELGVEDELIRFINDAPDTTTDGIFDELQRLSYEKEDRSE